MAMSERLGLTVWSASGPTNKAFWRFNDGLYGWRRRRLRYDCVKCYWSVVYTRFSVIQSVQRAHPRDEGARER